MHKTADYGGRHNQAKHFPPGIKVGSCYPKNQDFTCFLFPHWSFGFGVKEMMQGTTKPLKLHRRVLQL